MVPILSEESMVEAPKEDESRVDALERIVTRQGKRIGDLERYAKLQTCAIEQLFSICYSLQDSNENVSCMRSSLCFVDSPINSCYRQLSRPRFVVV